MSNTFGFSHILLIFALAITMLISAGHASAESDTANDALMDSGVWVAEIQGWKVMPGTIRRLGPPGTFYQPMINRAGTWVAFWGSEIGKKGGDIWIAATDGSRWQQLTFDGGGNEGPQWSPDGQLIVYSSTRGSSRSHVWVMNADGSNNRQLIFDPFGGARPTFYPDGNTIVFTSNPPGAAKLLNESQSTADWTSRRASHQTVNTWLTIRIRQKLESTIWLSSNGPMAQTAANL